MARPVPQFLVGESNFGGFGFGPNPDPQIYVYRLLGPPDESASWERTVIDAIGTHEGEAVDLDGDDLPDLVGHDENTNRADPPRNGSVYWWKNRGPQAG